MRNMHPLVRSLAFAAVFTAAVLILEFSTALFIERRPFVIEWRTLALAAGVSFAVDVARNYLSR